MAETPSGEKASVRARDKWRERVAEQQRSGLSVIAFCKGRDFTAHTFYEWRKRLRASEPVRFALVERGAMQPPAPADPAIELALPSGERLRIANGADPATVRAIVVALRA